MPKEVFYVRVVRRGYNSLCFAIPIPLARKAHLKAGLQVHLEWDGAEQFVCTVLSKMDQRAPDYEGVDERERAEVEAFDRLMARPTVEPPKPLREQRLVIGDLDEPPAGGVFQER